LLLPSQYYLRMRATQLFPTKRIKTRTRLIEVAMFGRSEKEKRKPTGIDEKGIRQQRTSVGRVVFGKRV